MPKVDDGALGHAGALFAVYRGAGHDLFSRKGPLAVLMRTQLMPIGEIEGSIVANAGKKGENKMHSQPCV